MPGPATFESFSAELSRLVAKFEGEIHEVKAPNYSEARLREDYLNPFITALGWDRENHAGLVQSKREIEIESRTDILGRAKRADYLFRTDGTERFICEAKKPREELGPRYAFQAKRYAWNKKLHVALLTDFEELKVYLVGGKPRMDEPHVGEWKSWHYKQYPLIAREIWDMLSRERVAAGCIDAAIDALPKKPAGKGKARQAWLIKPDRTRELDTDFLEFLDGARRDLASDILKHNERADVLEGTRLNEATHCILDRLLFIRICEDREIETGDLLQTIVEKWRRNYGHDEPRRAGQESPRVREDSSFDLDDGGGGGRSRLPRESLWRMIVDHFHALNRPGGRVPFFNGNLFKKHFSEDLLLGDEWLAQFIGKLSDDNSEYLFNIIPVEILGSVYERFLGKVVRPHGRGVTIEEKPEVRKAGGVYYTPRYIVDYIVEQTVGRQLDAIACGGNEAPQSELRASGRVGVPPAGSGVPPEPSGVGRAPNRDTPSANERKLTPGVPRETRGTAGGTPTLPRYNTFEKATRALRLLDPACGSGSFLIRAFERVCEHWQRRFTLRPRDRDRSLCWTDPVTGDVHLTVALKRRILRDNIHGVDLDAQAVEVTQLSLYLKMLEGEDRTTLQRQRELLRDEKETALLPPLGDNIKCGNSLIASDFSMMPEDLVRVNAFDWEVGFREIMKAGGFDAVIGNPPYRMLQPHNTEAQELDYLKENYVVADFKIELFHMFLQRGVSLLKAGGMHGHIVPTTLLNNVYAEKLRRWLMERCAILHISVAQGRVFEDADVHTSVVIFRGESIAKKRDENELLTTSALSAEFVAAPSGFSRTKQRRFSILPGATWNILLNESNAPLIERLKQNSDALENVGTINRGLVTGDREKYFSPQKTKASHVPIIVGGDVNRYFTKAPSEFVLFERPDAAGGCWDKEVHLAQHKIVIRQIGVEPTASVITEPFAVTANIFTVRASSLAYEKYLLAILNSKLTAYFWRTMFADFKASFPQVTIFSLSQVPIRKIDFKKPADKARHDKLVMLVDKMLALTPKLRAAKSEAERATLQNAVTATDRQIDEAVYALYALTPEEIALVEGG